MDTPLRNMAKQYKGMKATTIEKAEAYKSIGLEIRDWLPKMGFQSLECFQIYVKSGRVVLPFAGGWLDQPEWVHNDFRLFEKILDYHMYDLDQPTNTGDGNQF